MIIVHVQEGGVGSTLPSASFARAEKVCEPWAKSLYLIGLRQLAQALPSSLHSNVRLLGEVTSSLPINKKIAALLLLGLGG